MERTPKLGWEPGIFTTDAMRGLRGVAWHDAPLLLAYYPVYAGNPYQSLLYGAAREHGIAPVPMPRVEGFDELRELQARGIASVLHLHWLHAVQRDATSEQAARRRARSFLDRVDAYLAAGGRLAWTVHNALPHETRFERAEIDLTQAIIERASVIHVLTERTPELVSSWYSLPASKVLHVPHPSYRGVYSDHVSRLDARHALELMDDEHVVVALGAIRPYKGIEELLDAWPSVPTDRPRRLVIAGATSGDRASDALEQRAAVTPRVIVDPHHVPNDAIQDFLRAADVAVFPYRRALNSGALLLALTFGLPVIVPADGGLAETVDDAYARTFVPGDRASLTAALAESASLATDAARAAAAAAARDADPVALAGRFAVGLRSHLDGSPSERLAEPDGNPVLSPA